jgi:alkanesulfonate monooxygenase SsuD/methylene tetrahydromethanopterin reductase-like flavin-dependent oxidoreductase (luciferase family)
VGLAFPPSFHLGVQLATTTVSWPEIRDAATRIEELGYDSLWVPDHLLARETGAARLEAWQVLAAIAASTRRIRIGPLVSPVTFRHPAVLAKMAATLDHVSDGRLILGLGAAGLAAEHATFGIPFGPRSERVQRLDEACVILRSMLDDPRTTFIGRYYQVRDATAAPKPIQSHLPILIGGGAPSVVGIAARRADMWNMIATPDAFAPAVAGLRARLDAVGRGRAAVAATASFRAVIRATPAAIATRIDQLDPVWRDDPYRLTGDAADIRRLIGGYAGAGADGVILQMPAPYDFETLASLAAVVGT